MEIFAFFARARSRIQATLTFIMAVLSVMGIITFSLFILEESFQTVMFGTWPAQDAKRWDLVKAGTEHMRRIHTTINVVNYGIGWIQPFAFVSYREYAKASAFYIESLRAKAIANAPELFIGEHIEFEFSPRQARTVEGGLILVGGPLNVLCLPHQKQQTMSISGKIILLDSRPTVDIRQQH